MVLELARLLLYLLAPGGTDIESQVAQTRAKTAQAHLERGRELLEQGRSREATTEFRCTLYYFDVNAVLSALEMLRAASLAHPDDEVLRDCYVEFEELTS